MFPWLSITVAIISFFATKKKTGSSLTAAVVGGLAGAGTYYATHYTGLSDTILGQWDGVPQVPPVLPEITTDTNGNPVAPAGYTIVRNADGSPALDANGHPQIVKTVVAATTDPGTNVFQDAAGVVTSWGPLGTALAGGAIAAVTGNLKPFLIGGGIILGIILLMR